MELGGEPRESLQHRPVLEKEGLSLLQETVGALFADYGWYIFLVCIAVYFLIQKLSGRISLIRASAPAVTEDPSEVVRQHEAVAAARLRMQEELNAQAEKFRERQKQLEEDKRRQKIEMWESMKEGKSYKASPRPSQPETVPSTSVSSTAQKSKSDKKSLRGNGYNPLTGAGGGTCAWRPGRRGPSSGGG